MAAFRRTSGPTKAGHYVRAALILLAIGVAFAPTPAAPVERYYSGLAYPALQRGLTAISNFVPFALVDALLLAGVAWIIWAIAHGVVKARSDGPVRAAMRLFVGLATLAATVYLSFLVTWGLNYRRLPLTEKVPFDPHAISADATRALALSAVGQVNALYERAHLNASPVDDASLADAFARAQQALGVKRPARPGRPKWSILDVYFNAADIPGMTDPFFLETLVVSDLLPFERPFVIAHEWSHLAGFANEGEANFVGWLTCTKGSDADRYSGWLFLYGEVVAELRDRRERSEVAARLGPGPRADLGAAAERRRRNMRPAIANAGRRVNDRYLKANRVETGTASYAEVVRLVLGVRLDPT